jgi:hypothetical protein
MLSSFKPSQFVLVSQVQPVLSLEIRQKTRTFPGKIFGLNIEIPSEKNWKQIILNYFLTSYN